MWKWMKENYFSHRILEIKKSIPNFESKIFVKLFHTTFEANYLHNSVLQLLVIKHRRFSAYNLCRSSLTYEFAKAYKLIEDDHRCHETRPSLSTCSNCVHKMMNLNWRMRQINDYCIWSRNQRPRIIVHYYNASFQRSV